MKVFAVLILAPIVAYASAATLPAPVHEHSPIQGDDGKMIKLEDVDTDGGLSGSTELTPVRHRRLTRDLLSAEAKGVKVNPSACAAKCLIQKRKGGVCRNGICHCR